MNYAQILNLLDRGLSPEQILAIRNAPDIPAAPEAPEEQEKPEAVVPAAPAAPEQMPEWAAALNQSITRMTNALHASAIANSQQPELPPETAEEALAAVIAPPTKKGR